MPVKLRYFLSGECSSFSPALTQDEVTSHVLDVLASRPLTIRSSDPRLANQRDCVYENSSL